MHGPFGDVSGLNKHGSTKDEVHGVSHCGQNIFAHDQFTSNEQNPHRVLHPVVDNNGCRSNFRKERMTFSVLNHAENARPYTLGNISHYNGFSYRLSHAYIA